jgi:UDP-glucuronate 4-epimerase
MQPGDVPMTCADISAIARDYGYAPRTALDEGIGAFMGWLKGWQARSFGEVSV